MGETSRVQRDRRAGPCGYRGWCRFVRTRLRDKKLSSAPQGEGSDEARTWFKRAGHGPAAQEGGGGRTEGPLFPLCRTLGPRSLLSHFMGSLGRVPAKEWHGPWPPLFVSKHNAPRRTAGPAADRPAGGLGGLWGPQLKLRGQACRPPSKRSPLNLQPTWSGGSLGTSSVTWAFLRVG